MPLHVWRCPSRWFKNSAWKPRLSLSLVADCVMGNRHIKKHQEAKCFETCSNEAITRRRVPPCISMVCYPQCRLVTGYMPLTERTPFSPLWVGGPSPVSTLSHNSHNEMHIEHKVSLTRLVCSTSKPGCRDRRQLPGTRQKKKSGSE